MSRSLTFDPEPFARLISREHDEVELKSGVGRDAIQAAMVAMSNTTGGRIFIGVDGQRRVVGRIRDQGTDDAIHEAALAARNVGRYSIERGVVGDVEIVVVAVEQRTDEIAQTSDGRVLVRRGGRNVALFASDLWSLMTSRALHRFESSDSGLSASVVDETHAREVATRFEWLDSEQWPNRWLERRLLHANGNLTVAGALALTDPAVTLGAAKFDIDLRSYEDDHTTSYVRREEIHGPVHEQVRMATDWVLRDVGTEMVITGAVRHDVTRLPSRAVREAIANAVAHRDYSIDRAPIVVEVRPSSVVIRSPGRLPSPVTIATLRQAQSARNPTVIDVLRRFGLAEDGGQGIDVIEDQLRYELLHDPTFREVGDAFEVTLPLRGLVSTTERGWLSEFGRQGVLDPSERPLLLAAVREGQITNARAREVMGVDSVRARTAMQRLVRVDLLRQHGERGRAYYTLGVIGPDRNPEEALLAAAIEGPLSNERVRQITGLDRAGALILLRRLVRDGRLLQSGIKRGTRYSLPSRDRP
ncbi:MAG: putative DNA binding domain-containing protein [Gordonia polyisoprenivorans]|nr:putative DNA binding domain-containing protein [Gordonia polyisoprenivorans]